MLEFWNPETRPRGWLWLVESGGWFSLEKLREGFLQGYNEDINHKEYLILGDNDCINILTLSEPIIIDSE